MGTHTKLLDIQTSIEGEQNKENLNSELIHREKVEGSPLWIVGNKEHGYFVAMGNHRLTDSAKTISEAREKLINEQYNIIANMIVQIVGTMDVMNKDKGTVNELYREGIEVNK